MIRFNSSDKSFTIDRSHCGKCENKINPNALEPVYNGIDYYHVKCLEELEQSKSKGSIFRKQIGLKQSILILGSVIVLTGIAFYYLVSEVLK